MFLPEPPVSPWATVLPLVLVMGVCMVKQVEDNDDADGGGDLVVLFHLQIGGRAMIMLMMMQGYEDILRHRSDSALNKQPVCSIFCCC